MIIMFICILLLLLVLLGEREGEGREGGGEGVGGRRREENIFINWIVESILLGFWVLLGM